ncbi:MAG: hypothetical protein HY686_04415 [Chloroflexi bacterium]|nr:hypothetical protein [Chloroflexota bacterium]
MDGDFRINLEEAARTIATADVLSLFFPMVGKALLLDTRYTAEEGPLVKVVPMATSIAERLRSLRRLRPQFPRPESLTVIPWYRSVDSLVRLGLFQRIVQRFVESGHPKAVQACYQAVEELRRHERLELAAVLRGDNYRTIWARKG